MKCEYGCGEEATFQLKSGKWCCSKSPNSCPVNKEKNRQGLKKAHKDGKMRTDQFDGKRGWRKGLTKETDERIVKGAQTYVDRLQNGEIVSTWTGKCLSKEHREAISKGRIKNLKDSSNFGFVKTKYYTIYCPYIENYVNVQGSWEYKYASYLNEKNIKWIHSRKYILTYFNEIERRYFPDFYLPELDEYHEVKGWFMDSDKEKMKYVIKCNKNKRIRILQKKQLEKLGIDLKSPIDRNNSKTEHINNIKILKHEITWIHDKATVWGLGNFDSDLIYERRKALETSNINLMSFGWVGKVAKLWNVSHAQVRRIIKKYFSDLRYFERNI